MILVISLQLYNECKQKRMKKKMNLSTTRLALLVLFVAFVLMAYATKHYYGLSNTHFFLGTIQYACIFVTMIGLFVTFSNEESVRAVTFMQLADRQRENNIVQLNRRFADLYPESFALYEEINPENSTLQQVDISLQGSILLNELWWK